MRVLSYGEERKDAERGAVAEVKENERTSPPGSGGCRDFGGDQNRNRSRRGWRK